MKKNSINRDHHPGKVIQLSQEGQDHKVQRPETKLKLVLTLVVSYEFPSLLLSELNGVDKRIYGV